MTPSNILRCIAAMNTETKAELLIGIGRIMEPDAQAIGSAIGRMEQTSELEPLNNFISDFGIGYSLQYRGCDGIDRIEEGFSGLKLGLHRNHIVTAWAVEGAEIPDFLMDSVRAEAHRWQKVEVQHG